MRPLTNSELSCHRRCRRKWWLAFHRGLHLCATPDPASPREVGSAYHLRLARLYDAGEVPVDDGTLSGIMAAGYADWLEETGEDRDLEVVQVERTVQGDLHGVSLWAKADLRYRRDGRYGVMDHKTGDIGTYERVGRLLTQPLHYLLVERLTGAGPIEWAGEFVWNIARRVKRTVKAKPPFYARVPMYKTDREVQAYAGRVEAQAAEVGLLEARLRSGENPVTVAFPTPTTDCSWDCDFYAVCPMLDENRDGAEAVIQLSYEEGDPLAHHTEVS